jgi:hypothetical protein
LLSRRTLSGRPVSTISVRPRSAWSKRAFDRHELRPRAEQRRTQTAHGLHTLSTRGARGGCGAKRLISVTIAHRGSNGACRRAPARRCSQDHQRRRHTMDTYYKPADLARFPEMGENAPEIGKKFFEWYGAVFADGALTGARESR